MRTLIRMAISLSAVAMIAAVAGAQDFRGRINGTVSDHTGADGSFRFLALPPGVYAVSFDLAGFQTVKREGIRGRDANAGYFDFGSFEEFQIGGAGSDASNFAGGASMSISVKSGGDRFSGSWFNLTNAGTVTTFRNATGPTFREVTALLDPRIVRFAIRFDF